MPQPLHGHLPSRSHTTRQGDTVRVRRDRRPTAENVAVPRQDQILHERATHPAFETIRRAQKRPKQPGPHPGLRLRRHEEPQDPLKPEIAPENPQERFLFVSTGPFREEFCERPLCGLFTNPFVTRNSEDRGVQFPPRPAQVSSNALALCAPGQILPGPLQSQPLQTRSAVVRPRFQSVNSSKWSLRKRYRHRHSVVSKFRLRTA